MPFCIPLVDFDSCCFSGKSVCAAAQGTGVENCCRSVYFWLDLLLVQPITE